MNLVTFYQNIWYTFPFILFWLVLVHANNKKPQTYFITLVHSSSVWPWKEFFCAGFEISVSEISIHSKIVFR